MYDHLHYFQAGERHCAVALPFPLAAVVEEWRGLRSSMARQCFEPFTREEWGYLLEYLEPSNLLLPFVQSFGKLVQMPTGDVEHLLRPRGLVAVWLPNNVGILGPLMLVIISLTGNPVKLKVASQGQNLAKAFMDFALPRLSSGSLRMYLEHSVVVERFDHGDSRNLTMAAEASVRLSFGSDESVAVIEALPHPIDSIGFGFRGRQSEAWIEAALVDEAVLRELIQVFSVYGQAGCTSPRRLVVLDGHIADCIRIRDELLRLWPQIVQGEPSMSVASANVAAKQWAMAAGWDAVLAQGNACVLAIGSIELPTVPNVMTLEIVPATVDDTINHLPANIQTIGYMIRNARVSRWLSVLASTKVKRLSLIHI